MGVFIGQGDHDCCGVPPSSSEQGSRFESRAAKDSSQCKLKPQIYLPRMEKIKHRPICITSVSPGSNLNVMETRSFQQKQGYVSDLMDTPKRVRFYPILTVRSCIK